MSVLMNPDCLDGKHRACSGDGWCESTDQAVPCPCDCHQKDKDVEAFWDFFKDDIANAPVLTAAELGEHSMRSHMHRNDPPRADGQHYDGCPCGTCQALRVTQPVAAAMQAKHLSGASIGKLVEWEVGKSLTTGERQWSPIATLAVVAHGHDETNLTLQWDDYGIEETTLHPDDWVRVTAPAATGQEAA